MGIRQPSFGHVLGERRVEIENLLLAELHDGVGEHGFADRAGFEHRIGVDRRVRPGIQDTEASTPNERGVFDKSDRQAGYMRRSHERLNLHLESGN
jgi:hypothetical protein